MTEKNKTAALILIGNEVLSGRTKDANLPFLAETLNSIGIQLAEARVIRDEEAAIVEAVNTLRNQYDYVFTTGGIGPTHDDITSAAVAKAFGKALIRHPDAVAAMTAHYEKTGRELNEARLKMTEVPEGATLVENALSVAPGFRIGNVFVLAGVPSVMRSMVEWLLPQLERGAVMMSRTLDCYLPEGTVAKPLGEVQDRFPDLEIGSYPFFRGDRYGCSLVLRGTDGAMLSEGAEALYAMVSGLGGEAHWVEE